MLQSVCLFSILIKLGSTQCLGSDGHNPNTDFNPIKITRELNIDAACQSPETNFEVIYCPDGWFMKGAEIGYEPLQDGPGGESFNDNTGLAYFAMICTPLTGWTGPGTGVLCDKRRFENYPWTIFQQQKACPGDSFVTGFDVFGLPGRCDFAGVTNLAFQCSDGSTWQFDPTFVQPHIDPWEYCPTGSYVCGSQSGAEPYKGVGPDDAGLQRLRLACCSWTQYTSTPTLNPTKVTVPPTKSPSLQPSATPTSQTTPPTMETTTPTNNPTFTFNPTSTPTFETIEPSITPSTSPSTSPTITPSVSPSRSPTKTPTTGPTRTPSKSPSVNPSGTPTSQPTTPPTLQPTDSPTIETKSPTPTGVGSVGADKTTNGGRHDKLLLILCIILAIIICCILLGIWLYCMKEKRDNKENNNSEINIEMDAVPSNPPSARNSEIMTPPLTNQTQHYGESSPQPPNNAHKPTKGQSLPSYKPGPTTAGGDKALDLIVQRDDDWDEKEMDQFYDDLNANNNNNNNNNGTKYLYKPDNDSVYQM